MSVLEAVKKKYNELVIRRNKADEFYNNPKVSDDKKEKWMPEYLRLMQELSVCIVQYERLTGQVMSKEEIWEGFR